jgi:hypothetical protein
MQNVDPITNGIPRHTDVRMGLGFAIGRFSVPKTLIVWSPKDIDRMANCWDFETLFES